MFLKGPKTTVLTPFCFFLSNFQYGIILIFSSIFLKVSKAMWYGGCILCVLIFIILVLPKALFSEAAALDLTIPFLCWDILLIFSLKNTNYFYTNLLHSLSQSLSGEGIMLCRKVSSVLNFSPPT